MLPHGRCILLLVLLCLGGVQAQPRQAEALHPSLAEPRFESVGVGAIPRGVVATMAQDRTGFLWLATGDGLVRYDGYRFRPQERDSADPRARNLGWIRALLPARDGRLWIGTEADGLAVYDPASEQVHVYRSDAAANGGGAAPSILALAEDRDGAVWVGSAGGGVERFDPARQRFTSYRRSQQPGSLPDDRIQSLLVDRQGTLWVGHWRGLSRRPAGSDRFESVFSQPGTAPTLAERSVTALLETADGRLWVGTQQGQLAIVDPATAQGRVLEPAAGGTTEAAGAVSQLLEAPDGQIWVGRTTGIDQHAAFDGRLLRRVRHDPRTVAGLAGNEVTGLLMDRAGWIWVAGLGVGLQRHNPANRSLWLRGADLAPDSPLNEADVRSLLQLTGGEIWAATPRGGVVVMDPQLQAIGAVVVQDPAREGAGRAQPPAQPFRVNTMAEAADGTVWLGGEMALWQFDHRRQPLRSVHHGAGQTHQLLAGRDGSLWVATQDGLFALRPGSPALQPVTLGAGQPLRGDVFVLAEAADDALWVGSVKGLFHIAPGARELQPVATLPDAGLGNPIVIGLLIDRQQTLWVDTAVTGLHRMSGWDGQRARFDRVSERHGVLNRPFGVNLLEDRRGRIWSHLYVYDPTKDRLDELTAADGVIFGTGWFRSYVQTHDGRFLFGGSKGLLVVAPEGFDASSYSPPVVASELRLNGQRSRIGALLDGLQITPGQRSFSLEFAALDYSDPRRARYAYQLEGFDPDWITTGAEFRVASYSNLDPGDYLLKVRATNRSGVWSPHEIALPVHVLPAWWQGWGFRLLMLALAAALLYGVVQLRTRQLRGRQLALELKVRERTVELEAMARALRQESAALAESSLSDPLTGLRNRRFFTQHIDGDAALAVRRHEGLAPGAAPPGDADLIFFLVDIDQFKQVNDELGHAAGDAVIVQMRGRLQQVFRESDYLVRWGGEEFLVVARGTSRRHAAELAERARAVVCDQPFVLDDGRPLDKTCSVGFCCFPLSTQHPNALDWAVAVNIADAALYAVKGAGRNGWLGVTAVRDGSPDHLPAWARRPLAEWWQSGGLEVVRSPGLETWGAD